MNKNNQHPVLYAYSKDDLENLINLVIDKVRKTELLGDTNISPEEDRLSQKEACLLLGITTAKNGHSIPPSAGQSEPPAADQSEH
ncbi:MAG: hypothetical protein JJ876_11190, partial [Muricauda sp.]|nr:hypothetical protein [Allomuricauda sp.]